MAVLMSGWINFLESGLLPPAVSPTMRVLMSMAWGKAGGCGFCCFLVQRPESFGCRRFQLGLSLQPELLGSLLMFWLLWPGGCLALSLLAGSP